MKTPTQAGVPPSSQAPGSLPHPAREALFLQPPSQGSTTPAAPTPKVMHAHASPGPGALLWSSPLLPPWGQRRRPCSWGSPGRINEMELLDTRLYPQDPHPKAKSLHRTGGGRQPTLPSKAPLCTPTDECTHTHTHVQSPNTTRGTTDRCGHRSAPRTGNCAHCCIPGPGIAPGT